MTPISPSPITAYAPRTLPAYLSNGVVGLRLGWVPPVHGVSILNGFAGIDPDTHTEAFARTPFPLALDVAVDGVRLSNRGDRGALRSQRYDFATGELTTEFVVHGADRVAEVTLLTFCIRTLPTVVAQEITVRVDGACDLELSVGVDATGVDGSWAARAVHPNGSFTDGSLLWRSLGGVSTCGIAYTSELAGAEAEPRHDTADARPLRTAYSFRAHAGRRYRLRQLTSLVPDVTHPQPDSHAVRLVAGATTLGFDRVREDNRRAWSELWRGRPQLAGAPQRWQELVDAAFFYLHSSAHASSPCSTSMFGLAFWPDYHYYRGHVMWDIETFCVPPLVLTSPGSARALLDYRVDRLEAARANAAMAGYLGAQFPWESSPSTGHEASPGEGEAAAYEHHVSLDVAFALLQYLHATRDKDYGIRRARPVLAEICRWIESRVVRTARGFEIHRANGVAEKEEPVDNNAFMNMATAVVLRETLRLAPWLELEPKAIWATILKELYIPLDRRTKVIKNHDGYRAGEEKGETPEAPAGLFPFSYEVPRDVEQATLRFYLELADRYVGSPMLSAVLGVYAAWVGDRERSLELFERGYADFVVDPFRITTEYSPSVFPDQPLAGPFAANIGAFLSSCLYGLTGMRFGADDPQHWFTRPVVLPAGWDAIHVERLWVHGEPFSLEACHGERGGRLISTAGEGTTQAAA